MGTLGKKFGWDAIMRDIDQEEVVDKYVCLNLEIGPSKEATLSKLGTPIAHTIVDRVHVLLKTL